MLSIIRQSRFTFVTRYSINLAQKIPESNEAPFCNVVFDFTTGQGPYVKCFECACILIAIANEGMHRAGISRTESTSFFKHILALSQTNRFIISSYQLQQPTSVLLCWCNNQSRS